MENILAEPENPAFVFAVPNNQKAEALAFKIIATHSYSLHRLIHFTVTFLYVQLSCFVQIHPLYQPPPPTLSLSLMVPLLPPGFICEFGFVFI